MVYDYFDKYTFMCEAFNEDSEEFDQFILNFFPFDNSVQVVNNKKHTVMVKRVQYPFLKKEMLFIGNIINVFSRLLRIVDCAPLTKKTLFNNFQSTFALIKPMPPSEYGKVFTFISKKGFRIVRMKNAMIDKDLAVNIYQNIGQSSMLPVIVDYITSGEVIGIELLGSNAVAYWRSCLGATDPSEAEPGTLRQMYGQDKLRNVAHGCNTQAEAALILDMFFGHKNGHQNVPYRATMNNCTCCVVKPHVLIDGNLGAILEDISTAGPFYIAAMGTFTVGIANAAEFYEVYKNVIPEYESMVQHLTEGSCVALEVKCKDEKMDPVSEFRKLCGPRDPDLARQLYPDCIRAHYGKDTVHNAVHCTDLPEDGVSEVQYFFKLMTNIYKE